mmetsp:Transcript_15804/g.19039  ORF Transcript_15804/g.19039 Transcript_15804/m.19039 type:complete len:175 (-) Transcript_15804:156-680(-)
MGAAAKPPSVISSFKPAMHTPHILLLLLLTAPALVLSSCVDDNVAFQQLTGKAQATCAFAAQSGACAGRCSNVGALCCASCLPECEGDVTREAYCEILVSLPDSQSTTGVTTNVMLVDGCDMALWGALKEKPEEAEAGVREHYPSMLAMKLNGPRIMLIHGPGMPCCNATGLTC